MKTPTPEEMENIINRNMILQIFPELNKGKYRVMITHGGRDDFMRALSAQLEDEASFRSEHPIKSWIERKILPSGIEFER